MSYRARRCSQAFKVLIVGSIHPNVSDDLIRDTLYRQFRKFGDTSVRILLEPEGRVAFVYFHNSEEACDALNSKPSLVFYDQPATVKPVIDSWPNETSSSTVVSPATGSTSPPSQSSSSSYQSPYRSRSPIRGSANLYKDYHFQTPYSSRGNRGQEFLYYPRGRGRGGYEGGRGAFRGRPGWQRPYDANRNDVKKYYPYYNYHVPPEEDILATRTLFVGNLELSTTEDEIRKHFGRFGRVMEIVLKRPPPNTGNAFAFVRFENVDMAFLAKKELSGQFFGRLQCKIGYGKSLATSRVWVGGLGSWCSGGDILWREFDRFGVIRSLDYQPGEPFAIIHFESRDAAEAAVQAMRGFPLGGPENRIRVDFSDFAESETYEDSGIRTGIETKIENPLNGILTFSDLCKKIPKVWSGMITLKKSCFFTQLYLIDGSRRVVDSLKDQDGKNNLTVRQRLKMDPARLDDVTMQLNDRESPHSVFLGVPAALAFKPENLELQSQPLRNFISYLKLKDSAGVIGMSDRDVVEQQRVLYCFPPCDFVYDLLRHNAPDLNTDGKEEFIVVVVV